MNIYTSPYLTKREALDIAIQKHPLDLAARCAFLLRKADSSKTVSAQAAWLEALAATRGKHDRRH